MLGVALTLVVVGLTSALRRPAPGRDEIWKNVTGTGTQGASAPAAVRPAGIIEALEIPLASSSGVFPDKEKRLGPVEWFFADAPEERLARFLNACDLRSFERIALLDRRNWRVTRDGCTITPPEQVVWSLGSRAREQIYSVLSKSPRNFPQSVPFRWPLDGFERSFKESGLPAEQINKLRRLTYTNGHYLCFTDLQAAKAVLSKPEFDELVETLYGLPTYILRLRVNPDSDLDSLVQSWGKGGREKSIEPLLSSLARVPGGATINIVWLLPPFARLRLYTFPYALKDPTAARQDCFFTSLNFFNDPPDTNFFDKAYAEKVLRSQYAPIRAHRPLETWFW